LGTNTVATSPDGITWTASTWTGSTNGNSIFTNQNTSGVAWAGNKWVVAGNGGPTYCIATSTDGMNWTGSTTSLFNNAHGVASEVSNYPPY
jgi:hypothetical protein